MPPMLKRKVLAGKSATCSMRCAGSSVESFSLMFVWRKRIGSSIHQRLPAPESVCCAPPSIVAAQRSAATTIFFMCGDDTFIAG